MENEPETSPSSSDPTLTGQTNEQPRSLAHSGKVIQPISGDLATPSTSQPLAPLENTLPPPPAPAEVPQVAPTISTPTTNLSGLTGSQLQPQKQKLPIGIYVIAGFSLVGLVVSFFDTSQNSGIYSIIMLVDLLLTIGLLFRLEIVRKIILWLYGITLVLSVVSIVMLSALQQRLGELKSNYETAVARIDQNRLSSSQKQQLESMNKLIAEKEKQAGKAISFTYIKLGATATGALVIMIYLTRPKVRSVFRTLEA